MGFTASQAKQLAELSRRHLNAHETHLASVTRTKYRPNHGDAVLVQFMPGGEHSDIARDAGDEPGNSIEFDEELKSIQDSKLASMEASAQASFNTEDRKLDYSKAKKISLRVTDHSTNTTDSYDISQAIPDEGATEMQARTSCKNCVRLKHRCDQTLPKCLRCVKYGRVCGGYGPNSTNWWGADGDNPETLGPDNEIAEHSQGPTPISSTSFRPSKWEWDAAVETDSLVDMQTSTFRNVYYNTAHYNNPDFQPEEWTPELEDTEIRKGRKKTNTPLPFAFPISPTPKIYRSNVDGQIGGTSDAPVVQGANLGDRFEFEEMSSELDGPLPEFTSPWETQGIEEHTAEDVGEDAMYSEDVSVGVRGRAAPPGGCHSCNRQESFEWRRGPDGNRTLCQECGAHYEHFMSKHIPKPVSRCSSIDSIADSLWSSMTGSSMSSVAGSQATSERLVALLLADSILKDMFAEALEVFDRDKFERNLRRLLKDFASELRKEAGTASQRQAAQFVRLRARNSAYMICNSIFKQGKPRPKIVVEQEDSEETDSDDNDDDLDDMRPLELFIKTSESISQLRENLRNFIHPLDHQAEQEQRTREKEVGLEQIKLESSEEKRDSQADHQRLIEHSSLDAKFSSKVGDLSVEGDLRDEVSPQGTEERVAAQIENMTNQVEDRFANSQGQSNHEVSELEDHSRKAISRSSSLGSVADSTFSEARGSIARSGHTTGATADDDDEMIELGNGESDSDGEHLLSENESREQTEDTSEFSPAKSPQKSWTWVESFQIVIGKFFVLNKTTIPKGKKRIEWTCQCGHEVWDDFKEIVPGAAQQYRNLLDSGKPARNHKRGPRLSLQTWSGDLPFAAQTAVLIVCTGLSWLTSHGGEFAKARKAQWSLNAIFTMLLLDCAPMVLLFWFCFLERRRVPSSRGEVLEHPAGVKSEPQELLNECSSTLATAQPPKKTTREDVAAWLFFGLGLCGVLISLFPVLVTVCQLWMTLGFDLGRGYITPQNELVLRAVKMWLNLMITVYGLVAILGILCAWTKTPIRLPIVVSALGRKAWTSSTATFGKLTRSLSSGLGSIKSALSFSSFGSPRSTSIDLERQPRAFDVEAATQTATPAGPPRELLFLLLCYSEGRYATRLMQLDLATLNATSDRALFQILQDNYYSMRGRWLSKFSIRTLASIKFVNFEMYPSEPETVDVRKVDDIPPPENEQYRYAPVPIDVIPPVGDNHLMHFFHNPTCAANNPIYLPRFPKKLKEKLLCNGGINPGWGLQFVEYWDMSRLWLPALLVFGLGSLVFGITWAVMQRSIQDAFSVAGYIVAFATLSLGSLQASLVM